MLREMRIRSLGVITDATLALSPGLTVVTGETGAGKTMVVTGLGLLLGERADPGAVRTGDDAAVVEGRFAVREGSDVDARARAAGAVLDDGDLLVTRTVATTSTSGARSRAHLGGRSVPVAVLGELADDLVAVHGQSDQVLLRSAPRQRDALDAFAGPGLAALSAGYARDWDAWSSAASRVEELSAAAAARTTEADLLRAALTEVERARPLPGEDDELSAEAERLEHAEELRRAAEGAHAALVGDDGASGAPTSSDAATELERARRALDVAREHDRDLDALARRVAEVALLTTDVAADLASYSGSGAVAELDPARLDAVQTRRAELTALARARGGHSVADLLAWEQRAAERLGELSGDTQTLDDLVAERERLDAALVAAAGRISELRRRAARELGERATEELPGLAMPHTALVVEVVTTPAASAADLHRHGADEVSLVLAQPGGPGRPLARAASGGELSRVMLALELVLARTASAETFVFDEVDAGVGGRAAVGIGERLARLAATRQVVVVTHLPQVAAFADAHVRVVKSVARAEDGAGVSVSEVVELDDAERVRELARMLAGQEGSAAAREHARELMTLAEDVRGERART